jgi:hypothetical protein
MPMRFQILHCVAQRVDGKYKKKKFDAQGRKKFQAMVLRLAKDMNNPQFKTEFKRNATQLAEE